MTACVPEHSHENLRLRHAVHGSVPPLRRMVALGDSVTAGVGDCVLPGQSRGWSAHIAAALGVGEFINVATDGARARDLRDLQLAQAVEAQPDLATILVGGNDILRGNFDADSVGCDVGVACDALTRIGSHVVVVLLHDPRDSLPGPRLLRGVLGRRAQAVNTAVVAALDGSEAVTVVDLRGRLDAGDRMLWHIDRLHPGPRGHRAMARAVIGQLPTRVGVARVPVPAAPKVRPGRLHQAGWLVRHGLPWCAKRSLDLLPELVRVCWAERHLCDHLDVSDIAFSSVPGTSGAE